MEIKLNQDQTEMIEMMVKEHDQQAFLVQCVNIGLMYYNASTQNQDDIMELLNPE